MESSSKRAGLRPIGAGRFKAVQFSKLLREKQGAIPSLTI